MSSIHRPAPLLLSAVLFPPHILHLLRLPTGSPQQTYRERRLRPTAGLPVPHQHEYLQNKRGVGGLPWPRLLHDEQLSGFRPVPESVVFTMSIYQPNNEMKAANGASLVFAVEPLFDSWAIFAPPNWQVLGPSSSSNPSSSTDSAGGHLTAEIGTAQYNGTLVYLGDIIWVQIGIDPPPPVNSSVAAASKYSVWIDYDHVSHRMSVYVDAGEDTPKPANAIASKNLTISAQYALLGLFSSMGQLLQVHSWNSTVDGLPDFQDTTGVQDKTIILSSVLGSVAATTITTALVFLYLNSKYRRWKKEQDELTKIMQGIPGVPAHVDFTEIRKATRNFHETTKLGKGGFGAVYRCKLPPAAASSRSSRPGRRGAMDAAVKKFTREVEDHRCSDFIAEVSIINRLRHKNIVPVIGWSYNKGEALLIYEYMTNGSLDQHLFKNGSVQQQQQEDGDTSLRQWHTRYGIARDIATGLHYVHHEHEPMVLHRDIKASNIMLDSDFRARLGDFGIACTVAVNRSSVTGIAGTWGYIAPDYAMSYKATRQTDIYAFGVLILEIVTGKKNGDMVDIPPEDDEHITDWIWRLHGEGRLLDAVDGSVLVAAGGGGDQQDDRVADEARRLLLLGLACTDPNPLDRPSMAEVLQVITKVMPPPDVPPKKPAFVWPPRDWRSRNSVYSTALSDWDRDRDRDGSLASTAELAQVSMEQPSTTVAGGHASVRSRSTQTCLGGGGDYTEAQSRRSP
ncbi:probable L-type lectin-domain containing receptor kinase S.5 isoform X2 [Miscanthus floridulus]|uniref:probable L-type lectin-domain containing receptor kinase S.5 isoform X2 n=1 Tax=Miscanthus floridulus TaxID=154761 RepID=UPI003457410F